MKPILKFYSNGRFTGKAYDVNNGCLPDYNDYMELLGRLECKIARLRRDVMTPTNIDPRTGLTGYVKQLPP